MVKLTELEFPPPGAALNTVTVADPAEAMSVAGIDAVSCVLLTNAVVRALPFQRTVELAMKPLPLTVNVNAAPPAAAAFGLTVVMAGAGLLIAKLKLFEAPPPGAGLTTFTIAVPAAERSLAGMIAVNCVLLTNVVVRGPLFQRTSEPATKFDPLTVSVNPAPPAVADAGLNVVNAGTGLGC